MLYFIEKPSEVYKIYNNSLFMLGPSKMIKLDVKRKLKLMVKMDILIIVFK
jgi:hypothetical protein